MAIIRPTTKTKVSTIWGNPITDEINRLTTESGNAASKLAWCQNGIAGIMQPVWKALPLASGYIPYGGGYKDPQYCVIGSIVHLRGLIKNNTGASITGTVTVATLPTEARPLVIMILSMAIDSQTSGQGYARRCNVNLDGTMVFYGGGNHSVAAGAYMQLDGSWFTKQV